MRLILWDLDGTLLRAGPVAREIFDAAVAERAGLDPRGHAVSMSGKTDPQIAAEILAALGVDGERAEALVPEILDGLAAKLHAGRDRIAREGWVMPGARELLAALDACEEVHQSVLTGNVAPNARVKTAALGLEGWFDWRVAASGSDDGDRRALVRVARRRAADAVGAPEVVWVVGDTPNDLACARADDARCVLVGTGHFACAELAGLGAEAVVDDLTDADGLVELLARG